MNNDAIISLVRHAITTAGSLLIAKGIGDEALWQAVGGGIVAIVGFFLFRKSQPKTESQNESK